MVDLTRALSDDPHVESAVGFQLKPEDRAVVLWQSVIGPILQRYGRRCPGWAWDEALARRLIADWRASHGSTAIPHQSIAPLHNLRGMTEPVQIRDGLAIRRMTDEDRDALWRGFGAHSSGHTVTVEQLEAWTDVIDLRWSQPRKPPLSDEIAIEQIEDLVTALRLHHPGVTGTTIVWTRPDPPDAPGASWPSERLYTPHGAGLFAHALQTHVGPGDAATLRALAGTVAAAREDRAVALALRRFNTAYERYTPEDALIDLWIAFEAVLVPDGTAELSYRAALRIARMAGPTPSDRERAFARAKRSYAVRSKVVHGDAPPDDLHQVLEETRDMARMLLRRWLLDPPAGGVKGVDRSLLE